MAVLKKQHFNKWIGVSDPSTLTTPPCSADTGCPRHRQPAVDTHKLSLGAPPLPHHQQGGGQEADPACSYTAGAVSEREESEHRPLGTAILPPGLGLDDPHGV